MMNTYDRFKRERLHLAVICIELNVTYFNKKRINTYNTQKAYYSVGVNINLVTYCKHLSNF